MATGIVAAVDARTDDQFVIMARTGTPSRPRDWTPGSRALHGRTWMLTAPILIFAEAVADLDSYRRFKAAVGVPILANITEFGMTPIFTKDELASADVDIVLYCCSAYRAMNAAALNVYQTIRSTGTQRDVIPLMQTRAEMYDFLDYYAYEQKLDELFRGDKNR